MKTTTFKNICSPSRDKTILIGTNKKNQRWFIDVESRSNAFEISRLIMRKNGKVSLNGWTRIEA